MKHLLLYLLLPALGFEAQTIADCRARYDNYLNFRGSLGNTVSFAPGSLSLNQGGKPQFTVYNDELPAVSAFFMNSSIREQAGFVKYKGNRHFSAKEIDSLLVVTGDKTVIRKTDSLPLRGYRIALDPGHFGTNMKDAMVEQKFLNFINRRTNDTVRIFESTLTFNTALILKGILEKEGADVFISRDRGDYTSFNCTFSDWMKQHRRRTLDSLRSAGQLSPARHSSLLSCSDYDFFWNFFRDYDLANRARRINAYDPHACLIIHYNVDEKNAPWNNHTPKNFSMAFIGGAFTGRDLDKQDHRLHFLRLLLTPQLDRSRELAGATVKNFSHNLGIPVARSSDATYLAQNCIATKSPGVFCRNLVLCRKINAVLVYGESLYQDNEKECLELMKCDLDAYGVKTNARLVKVAQSYYEAVMDHLLN